MTLSTAPAFLLQQGYFDRSELKPIAERLKGHGSHPPGLLLSYDDVALNVVRGTVSAGVAPMSPLIVDPGGHRYGRKTIGGKTLASAPWIARSAPSSEVTWAKTIAEALAEQRQQAADALLTPGIELEATDRKPFQAQIDATAKAAAQPGQDPPWFARVCVHEAWLQDAALQRLLLSQLTDLPDDIGVALHVRWNKEGVLRDQARLKAVRKVVEVIAADDRRLLLLQSGILGWLSLGWGGWGFSAALSHGQGWLDTALIRFGRPKGQKSPPKKKRYFEPSILHHVLDSDHARLAAHPSYTVCSCGFCQGLGSGNWDHVRSQQHGLYALAALTSKVRKNTPAARRAAVKQEIEAAISRWKALSNIAGLDNSAQPRHLDVWKDLL